MFHCRRGHGRKGAIRGRVAVRPNTNAGAGAESSALDHRRLTVSHRPRLKQQWLRPALGRQVQGRWRCPEVMYLGHLKSPHMAWPPPEASGQMTCPNGSNLVQILRRRGTHLKRMLLTEQHEERASSLPPNQPMERTLSCCALQRRSSAR